MDPQSECVATLLARADAPPCHPRRLHLQRPHPPTTRLCAVDLRCMFNSVHEPSEWRAQSTGRVRCAPPIVISPKPGLRNGTRASPPVDAVRAVSPAGGARCRRRHCSIHI
ncbi:hypothetical protein CBOM_07844 [Ceraceosorus bombacis]|uniref:Uncharacterized protein n=1 Tax=Ceraceosorus bombacis TaxID=401625 RepID=A0A0P1BMM3_9BASI|nr:hypothetical protein CBOM_07844 [Ceraceosorus bombacis]